MKYVNRVALRHVMHHNAAAIIYDHSESVLDELYETVAGLAMMTSLIMGASISQNAELHNAQVLTNYSAESAVFGGPYTPDERVVWHRGFLLALLDPTRSVHENTVRIDPNVKQQIFSDTPIAREYAIRLAASEVVVSFRVLDEAEHELARGSATTNPYGELQIQGALEHAVAVELSADGAVIIVPIQSSSAPVAATLLERAVMPRALARARRADANRAKWDKNSSPLPLFTVMFDSWKMFSSGFSIFGEIPVHRRMSVGGLVGLESLPTPTGDEIVCEVGGSWRFYVIGHVGAGLHLGWEGLRGSSGIVPGADTLDITSFGPTIGYKFSTHGRRTLDLAISRRYQMIDGSMGWRDHGWRWGPQVNMGWSF